MVNMTHFGYSHLRPDLAAISASFAELAHAVLNTLPINAERTTCLRKILEAKDCAVRAYLEGGQQTTDAEGRPTPGEKLQANTARAAAEADASAQLDKIRADAARIPTPEEDGVGAPMAQSSIEAEATIAGAQEKATRGPAPAHKARGAAK